MRGVTMYSTPMRRAFLSAESYRRHWRTSSSDKSEIVTSGDHLLHLDRVKALRGVRTDVGAVVVCLYGARGLVDVGVEGVEVGAYALDGLEGLEGGGMLVYRMRERMWLTLKSYLSD